LDQGAVGDTYRPLLLYAGIVLPVLTAATMLVLRFAFPFEHHRTFAAARCRLEAHIYTFRSRTGAYATPTTNPTTKAFTEPPQFTSTHEKTTPMQLLYANVQRAWASVGCVALPPHLDAPDDGPALAAHVERRARTRRGRQDLSGRAVCAALHVVYPPPVLDDGVFELQPVDYVLHRVVCCVTSPARSPQFPKPSHSSSKNGAAFRVLPSG